MFWDIFWALFLIFVVTPVVLCGLTLIVFIWLFKKESKDE